MWYVAPDAHRAGRAERAGLRVVELGRGELRAVVPVAAGDQDATVGEQRRGVCQARPTVIEPVGAERAGLRVVDLGRGEPGAGVDQAAGSPPAIRTRPSDSRVAVW